MEPLEYPSKKRPFIHFMSIYRLAGAGLFLFAGTFLINTEISPAAVTHHFPFFVGVGFNTAFCFGLLGLWLAITPPGRSFHRAAALLPAITATIAGIALIQYATEFYPADGLWRILVNTQPTEGGWQGRMSPPTALIILLFATVGGLLARQQQSLIPVIYIIQGIATLIALGSLTGHLSGTMLQFHSTNTEAGYMSFASSVLLVITGAATWQQIESNSTAQKWRLAEPGQDLFLHISGFLALLLVMAGVVTGSLLHEGEVRLAVTVALILAPMGATWLYWRSAPIIRRIYATEHDLDITSKQQALLLNHASQGICGLDETGRITFANPAACGLVRSTLEELTGDKIVLFMSHRESNHEICEEPDDSIIHTLKDGLSRHSNEAVLMCGDGNTLEVSYDIAAIRENDRISGAVILFNDISKEKSRQDSLRRSEATLALAQAQAHLGSWSLDIPNDVLAWSDENYHIFGKELGTPQSYESFLACVHPDDRAYVDKHWNACIAGAPYDIEHRLIVDGEIKWVRERAKLEFHPDGTPLRGIGTTQDITEIKRNENELLESRQMLRELAAHHEKIREAERRSIAREIHDELGQHLTALGMEASLLRINFGKTAPGIDVAARKMKEIIDTTISVVRNIAAMLRPSSLDLGLVSAAEWLLANFEKRTGIYAYLDAPQDELNLDDARTTAIFRILQESLTNITRYAQASEVRVILALVDNTLSIQVHDNGVGFDPSEVRNNKTFGLMGIRERALMFAGQARFHSHPGEGTTLDVTIPLDNSSAAYFSLESHPE